jgi:hypothetical protein
MRKVSAKENLRRCFAANVGKVISAIELRDAVGPNISEWARRVRELRENEGWKIATHHDRNDLRPGQYILTEPPPDRADVKFSTTISAKLRAAVLDRNGFTCQMCGVTPGEIDPQTGRKVRLHIGHIKDKSLGGRDELPNLRALCSTCNQGAKNITQEKPSTIWLLGQVRRANLDDQKAVFTWLKKKFA